MWREIELLKSPRARNSHKSHIYQNCLYIFFGQLLGKKLSDIWKFDILKESWTEIEVLVNPRSHTSSVQVNDKVYFYGGRGDKDTYNDFFYFDFTTEKIVFLECEPIMKSGCSSTFVYWNHSFYLFGGYFESKRSNEIIKFTEISENQYKAEVLNLKMNIGNSNTSHILVKDDLYLFGGYCFGDIITDSVIKFSFIDNTFTEICKLPYGPLYCLSTFNTTIKNKILMYGGSDKGNDYTKVYFFDIDSLQWNSIDYQGSNPLGTYHPSVSYDEKKLYVFGGFILIPKKSEKTLHVLDLSYYFIMDFTKVLSKKNSFNVHFNFN